VIRTLRRQAGPEGGGHHTRSGGCMDGGRQGAPSAVQVADRYHLVNNLSEAHADRSAPPEVPRGALPTLAGGGRTGRQGYSQRAIAEQLGLAPNTVASWLHAPVADRYAEIDSLTPVEDGCDTTSWQKRLRHSPSTRKRFNRFKRQE
jgi:hypothetical protein